MKKTREIRSVKDDAERLMQVIRQNAGASISEIAVLAGMTKYRTIVLLHDYLPEKVVVGVFPTSIFKQSTADVWKTVRMFQPKEIK